MARKVLDTKLSRLTDLVVDQYTENDFVLNNKKQPILDSYNFALETAKSTIYPDRNYLFRFYYSLIDKTPHLQTLIELRKHKLSSSLFRLTDGKEEYNDFITTKYFYDFLDYIIHVRLFGFGVLKLTEIKKGVPYFSKLKGYGINPLTGELKLKEKTLNLKSDSYKNELIFLNNNNDPDDIGLLSGVCFSALLNLENILALSKSIDKYGHPLTIGKVLTAGKNASQKGRDLLTSLENMGQSSNLVYNSGSYEIEVIQRASSGASQQYELMHKIANDDMAIGIIGNTMSTQEGSSYNQAELLNKVSSVLTKSDIKFAVNTFNDYMLPLLKYWGIIPNNDNLVLIGEVTSSLTIEEKEKEQSMKIEFAKYLKEVFPDKLDETLFNEKYGDLSVFKK